MHDRQSSERFEKADPGMSESASNGEVLRSAVGDNPHSDFEREGYYGQSNATGIYSDCRSCDQRLGCDHGARGRRARTSNSV